MDNRFLSIAFGQRAYRRGEIRSRYIDSSIKIYYCDMYNWEIGIDDKGIHIIGRRNSADIIDVVKSVAYHILLKKIHKGYVNLKRIEKENEARNRFVQLPKKERLSVVKDVKEKGLIWHAIETITDSKAAKSMFIPTFIESNLLLRSEDKWLRQIAVTSKHLVINRYLKLKRLWLIWDTFTSEGEVLYYGKKL